MKEDRKFATVSKSPGLQSALDMNIEGEGSVKKDK